jgi:hypothetical protein
MGLSQGRRLKTRLALDREIPPLPLSQPELSLEPA